MRMDYLENVRANTNDYGLYLEDKSSGIIIAFQCIDCGDFFTLEDESDFLPCHCHECANKEEYEDLRPDSEMSIERRERIAFFEEYGYPEVSEIKTPKPGDFVF